mmetsp:Transcript_27308/g.73817  ORF Transcript_27308/g.73817 Transcript_27308/m.73817 type:complete len:364 (+) Transcript_27308:117-1208(+)|eukprot:CAMPEP_0202338662 /NCGR_PEP_ID=MMETSP1126-20121109/846_1 /ASSEMBLY_ACC=CAM_ASM_000457 /TAXON_ID=3047 /ORGANISM="Dunaliella tertiolecta, Strain CCMP1320" /LENGTH=363 /DNA_ID=CAMNT_0048929081 /DNA_START=40 /DNA_END=1131 /DNA_ORIENTATION=-
MRIQQTALALAGGTLLGVGFSWFWRDVLKLRLRKGAAPIRVLITGAAGQIGYALCPLVANGRMFGPHQPVILHLLDIEPAKDALLGVQMELMDAALPLLHGVHTFTSVEQASVGVDVAIMVGGVPRKPGEERKDVMAKNVSIYKSQAAALAANASKGVKLVVVANPANTNAWVLKENSPGIPAENITCLTRLDHNRAIAQVGERAGVHSTAVKNVIIWGNHSSTQFPDVSHGSVAGQPIQTRLQGDTWLEDGFITTVQQRGAAILKARGLSSALSAASSVCDHVRDWMLGTPKGTWVSMGVVSDGSYGITPGLVFSYPVRCSGGKWSIVQGLQLDEPSLNRLRITEQELLEEREMALASAGAP